MFAFIIFLHFSYFKYWHDTGLNISTKFQQKLHWVKFVQFTLLSWYIRYVSKLSYTWLYDSVDGLMSVMNDVDIRAKITTWMIGFRAHTSGLFSSCTSPKQSDA